MPAAMLMAENAFANRSMFGDINPRKNRLRATMAHYLL
jgi:hypothetical protein